MIRFLPGLRSLAAAGPSRSELEERVRSLAQRNAELEALLAEHQKTLDELRRIQTDLARAQKLAKVGSWRWSVPRAELIEGSEQYAEIHGVDPSQIHELMKHQMERVIHPEDRERVQREFDAHDESGRDFEIEYRIVRPDGEIRQIYEIGESVFDESGAVIEQVGTVQDVTELKQAEAALQAAHDELEKRVWARTAELQHVNASLREEAAEREHAQAALRERELLLTSTTRVAKIGYAVWDERERKYETVSEEYAQIMGLSLDEFAQHYPSEIEDLAAIHPDDRERYQANEIDYNANPRVMQIEYRMISPEGETLHVRESMQPIFDETGRLVQSIITNQDITDQKRTEEQLRQAQKMEAVGQLTGGIAHDFNNLLAVIVGNLELADGEIDAASHASESIKTAIAAAERGAGLVQRLLAFSRTQSLRPAPIDANALVRGMLDLLRRTIGEHIEIELVREAALWQCLVDPNQLENAILNLAINARDAMLPGGTLTIATSNVVVDEISANEQSDVAPGQYVLVAVSDTGRGMTDEVRKRVFEPFYTTKEFGRGSGLGLSMVYGFAKQSGGQVSIRSEVDRGTTALLYLPRLEREEAHEAAELNSAPLAKAEGETILVVEDDPDLRVLMARMLRSLNYRVLEAHSSASALEILDSGIDIDLLLTDVVLPKKMSGARLVEEARLRRPDLRVLYMSGYSENPVVQQRQLEGDAELLQKPFRLIDVAGSVRRALARSKRGG